MNTRFLLSVSLFFLFISCIGLAKEPVRLEENSGGPVNIIQNKRRHIRPMPRRNTLQARWFSTLP